MKGQISNVALGVIVALVILFVGLYAINQVYDVVPEKHLYDYTYNTTSNTTSQVANLTDTAPYEFVIGNIVSIQSETADKEIIVYAENQSEDVTANATLNDVSLGTFSLDGVTKHTFTSVSFVANTQNNITIGSDASDETTDVKNVTIKFPRTKSSTTYGSYFTDLITNTGTIFDVLILVIIIVALGVAIAVLRGFGGTRGMPSI